MRTKLETVAGELRRLRGEGVARVFVADETLARVRDMAVRSGLSAVPAEPELVAVALEAPRRAVAPTAVQPVAKRSQTGEGGGLRWDGKPIEPIPAPPQIELPRGSKAEQMEWLCQRVLSCPVCNAHVRPGCKLVFGVGTPDAEIFFCGEGPGADEERQGEPFVGPAGQLLTKIIQAMGLSREKVYIGNIMKWRPEMPSEWGNREPTEAETAFSLPFLRAQLAIVKPKVIVALGKTAVNGLLGPDPRRKMTAFRGHWQTFDGTPLMPTFHPSYLLRNNALSVKREVWEDMMQVMERVGLAISEKQRGFFLKGN